MSTTPPLANPSAPFWGLDDLAVFLGVTYNSARTYHGRAEINRNHHAHPRPDCRACENGDHYPRPGDLPEPDEKFGRSPVWRPATIMNWELSRPGRGAGGGRRRPRVLQDSA